jgi:hypothetical protein
MGLKGLKFWKFFESFSNKEGSIIAKSLQSDGKNN